MRLFASKLLKDYQWELLHEQNLNLVTVPTPHPRDGLKINFRLTLFLGTTRKKTQSDICDR